MKSNLRFPAPLWSGRITDRKSMWSVHRRVLRIQEGLGDRLEGSQGGFGPREMHWDDTGSRAGPTDPLRKHS